MSVSDLFRCNECLIHGNLKKETRKLFINSMKSCDIYLVFALQFSYDVKSILFAFDYPNFVFNETCSNVSLFFSFCFLFTKRSEMVKVAVEVM